MFDTDDGPLPTEWLGAKNPYNEKALMCRALENNIFVAPANNVGSKQGSASCIVSPSGELVAMVECGKVGIAIAEIDLAEATARLLRGASGHAAAAMGGHPEGSDPV